MNYLSAENLCLQIADRWLFRDIQLGVLKNDKIALVGRNGCGKSTLLRLFGLQLMPDTGVVSLRAGIRVGLLPQNPVFDEKLTVYDNIFNVNNRLIHLVKNYEAHIRTPENSPGFLEKLHVLNEQMNHENAWAYEQQINEIIFRLGIGNLVHEPVQNLSGGQRKRVAIARVLIEQPDLILLDEPTNHLDLETIEWLERILREKFDTLIVVSHDRYFIDAVCNQIWEVDEQTVYKYKGNYAYFLEKKEERLAIKNTEIDKARNLMRNELEWIRRQPKARGTKAKHRVDAFYETQALASQKIIDANIQLGIKETRIGGKILEVRKISKKYADKPLIHHFSYTFKKSDRVGIIGKNGSGKTTFLEIITQHILPDQGEVCVGETTRIGYYRQDKIECEPEKRVIEIVKDVAEVIELKNGAKITASALLTRFMFPPAEQYKQIKYLSGGERKRLQLLLVLLQNPNFLVLDEPTNDLDIQTLNVLEDFLEEFAGVLVLVSHDRYFMDRLVNHLFVFEGEGRISDFPGNYSDYREWQNENTKSAHTPEKSVRAPQKNEVVESKLKLKLSYNEQRELTQLEGIIQELEQRKEQILKEIETTTEHVLLTQWAKELESLQKLLDDKVNRWLELSELQ